MSIIQQCQIHECAGLSMSCLLYPPICFFQYLCLYLNNGLTVETWLGHHVNKEPYLDKIVSRIQSSIFKWRSFQIFKHQYAKE